MTKCDIKNATIMFMRHQYSNINIFVTINLLKGAILYNVCFNFCYLGTLSH